MAEFVLPKNSRITRATLHLEAEMPIAPVPHMQMLKDAAGADGGAPRVECEAVA